MARAARRPPFQIAGTEVPAGKRVQLQLPTSKLVSGTEVAVPLIVLHGRSDGPTVWVSAAIHGDELNGVEIIRQVLSEVNVRSVSGTLLAVPVVNVHGFNVGERALPDGRDLNRSFPGSARGSMAARVANIMMKEVVSRCSVGIDLHTGSGDRVNLPQIRAGLDDPKTLELARVFGAPVTIDSRTRDGSLREVASSRGTVALLFEGGEANRFDPRSIEVGTAGVLRCLAHIGMIPPRPSRQPRTLMARSPKWTRSPRSGVLHLEAGLGDRINQGDVVASLHDPFGRRLGRIKARSGGMIVGLTHRALINQGEAVANIAEITSSSARR